MSITFQMKQLTTSLAEKLKNLHKDWLQNPFIPIDNVLPSLIAHTPPPLCAALLPHPDHAAEGLDAGLLVSHQSQLQHWAHIGPGRGKENDNFYF